MSLRDRLKNEIAFQEGYYEQAMDDSCDYDGVLKSAYAIEILNKVLSEVVK